MNARNVVTLPVGENVSTTDSIRSLVYDVRSCVQDAQNAALRYARRIGRDLIELRTICRDNDVPFSSMFRSADEQDDPAKLPFNRQAGYRLIAIAEHELLGDVHHDVQTVPSDWNSLYQLARLPAPKLKKLIDTGEVTADMSRSAAMKLAKENTMPTSKANNEKSQASKAAMSKRESTRAEFVACLKRLKVETRIDELRELARDLGLEITIRSKP